MGLNVIVGSLLLSLSACNTVAMQQRGIAKTINEQRGNIVTQNTLSTQTVSALMSYGIDERVCLVEFDLCLKQLNRVTLLKPKREVFALLAELYYAKARQIDMATTCETAIQRPPINPNFPNAYSSESFAERRQIIEKACNNTYLSYLTSAIRYSYAYLFYDDLKHNEADPIDYVPEAQVVITDTFVQTKDIYNAATSSFIKTLYSAQHNRFAQFDLIDSQPYPDVLSSLNSPTPSSNPWQQDLPNDGSPLDLPHADQVQVLRFSLPKVFINTADESSSILAQSTGINSDVSINNTDSTHSNHNELSTNELVDNNYLTSDNNISANDTVNGETNIDNPLLNDDNNIVMPLISEDNHASSSTIINVYLPNEEIYLNAAVQTDQEPNTARIFDSNVNDSLNNPTDNSASDRNRNNDNENSNTDSLDNAKRVENALFNSINEQGLYSDYDLNYSRLSSVSVREGFGVSFVTLLSNRQTTSITDFFRARGRALNNEAPESRIYRTGNLLLTGVVIPKGDSIEEVLNGDEVNVNLYNPRNVDRLNILGKDYSLRANFSSSYSLWLSENRLSSVGYLNMLARQQSMVLPQLFLLEPYDPNKRVVIMMHGLASSPATWVGITNDILNDDVLRQNFQVWQVFYPTQVPMLENRYQIQKLISTAYREADPEGQDPASQHSMLISHSMGAVISRMMLSNDDLNQRLETLVDENTDADLNRLIRQSYADEGVRERLQLNRLEQVDKAVFISGPFRGTDFAERWFTRALRRIVQLPLGFVQTVTGNLTSIATEGELTANPLGALYLQNGASQLSDRSSFMHLTADISIADDVVFHSIIANNDPDIAQGLAQLENTETKIDLSQYLPDQAGYADPYRPDRLPLSDLHLDEQTLARLVATPATNTFRTPQDEAKRSEALIATIAVAGAIAPPLSEKITDGIVPYTSAHLDGAKSETVITGGHGIQETPQAILLLREIMRTHLEEYPLPDRNLPVRANPSPL